ncbi:MAG: ATP-binding protein [Thermoleophilia bacterium]|nr:ATP-binding protein [Thermoleophilia bacterium]
MNFVDPNRLLNHRRYRVPSEARPADDTAQRRLRRIVLTGGPGSGKSTAASFLAREFTDELWVLPESATLLYKGGLPRATTDRGQQVAQRAIYTVQRSLEEATALQHPSRVQLCDRATVDGAAYWPDGADSFFRTLGTSRERELGRYDAVVFMHTAALLPAGYERDMEVRTEDRELAIDLDRRMFDLYADHPRLVAIDSHASFLDKLTTVRNAVAGLLEGFEAEARLEVLAPEPEAPLSSLMGLSSVQHVLPVAD